MNGTEATRKVRILFDETHSESWSISMEKAAQISPDYPEYSSYQRAADLLRRLDFEVARHTSGALDASTLADVHILALVHPCDPRWERTVGAGSPRLTDAEVASIQEWVRSGGGLLVITEFEHDKYGDNLNALLEPFNLAIDNGTVLDRARCINANPAWILGESSGDLLSESLLTGVSQVCFYQAGPCVAKAGQATVIVRASASASIPHAGLVAVAAPGKGRVVLATDSLLFGDDYLGAPDHQTFWVNLVRWLSVPAFHAIQKPVPLDSAVQAEAWLGLKDEVNALRELQAADGSVPADARQRAIGCAPRISRLLTELAPRFAHQAGYFDALQSDFARWESDGFPKPDFSESLRTYEPQKHRQDGIEHLALFPMYTPNASALTRFEALIVRMPWPGWLEALERARYRNEKFAPGHLADFTQGYRSECAVLFPETVSVSGKAANAFATLFCDREAKRLRTYALHAIEALRIPVPPAAECLFSSLPVLEDTVALWDLIHDRSHGLGELPFDPFMIRQRAPFWMYGLEELRVDLRSFAEAIQLSTEGFAPAEYIPFAILFDRLFRFPIVGSRVKNYDGLAGQLLFAFLHERETLSWRDNQLRVDWPALPDAMAELRRELALLYRHGASCSRLAFWIEAHDLVSKYVKPCVGSRWKRDTRAIDSELDPTRWIAAVDNDEFPLGNFHLNLKRKLA
ncbi:MAG: hypothetical protein HYR88_18095 [Verrucomicrobia bacterium]|nr:hypothetical protein [Verrucomicrobiota bacterium]MBI3869936.1 hypothetical protein [Verrucomicrobiota bacterium]